MEFVKYLLIGVSVSLDELAVGTIKGVQVKHMRRVDPWITGLYFAVFQGVMLIIGFYGASLFSKGSSAVTEWIADGLLMLIGANMVRGHSATTMTTPSSKTCWQKWMSNPCRFFR